MFHHGTIRKYTAAMLDLFNDLEIQYTDSNGNIRSRNIPIKYSSIEKYRELDNFSTEQLLAGNTNTLPRGAIALSTMIKAEQRTTNKNLKIGKVKGENTFEYMYNSVPFEFTFELAIMCRGMNEAAMIIEQIAPKFNPTVNIDVWDAENLNEPTRIPVKLLDIGIESNEYDELSSNIVTVNVGTSIMGNLYPPIKSIERVKEFKMYIAETVGNKEVGETAVRKAIMGWDVQDDGTLINGTVVNVDRSSNFPPRIVDVYGLNIGMGVNTLTAIYEDGDNKVSELYFQWEILSGGATIIPVGIGDTAEFYITQPGDIEVQCKITDVFGNYDTFTKVFTIA
jgi:hypothetical protein